MQPFTVFIPVFNEEEIFSENLSRLLTYLDSLQVPYEVLIGSNGSTDRTVELGESVQRQHPQVTFFHLTRRGTGLAFREGVKRARYDHIIFVEMDLSVELDFIKKAVSLLEDFDMVVGVKEVSEQIRPTIRKLGGYLFHSCASRILKLPFADYSPAAKAFRKPRIVSYLDELPAGSAFATYLIAFAFYDGARGVQIPVRCRDLRKSKINLAQLGLQMYGHLFWLWFLTKKRRGKVSC